MVIAVLSNVHELTVDAWHMHNDYDGASTGIVSHCVFRLLQSSQWVRIN